MNKSSHFKCNICDYETVCKSELETQIEYVHKKIKPFSAAFVIMKLHRIPI